MVVLETERESPMKLSPRRSAAITTLAALVLAAPGARAGFPADSQLTSKATRNAAGKQGATTPADMMKAQSGKQPRKQAPGWVEQSSFSFGAGNVGPGQQKQGPGKAGNAAWSLKQIQPQPPGSAASAQLPRRRMFVPPPK